MCRCVRTYVCQAGAAPKLSSLQVKLQAPPLGTAPPYPYVYISPDLLIHPSGLLPQLPS